MPREDATVARVVNRATLSDHGEVELRRAALDIVEAALAAADPYAATLERLQLEGDRLRADGLDIDLRGRRIVVLGAGKASLRIAEALEALLGPRIGGGLVVAKHGQSAELGRIAVRFAGHPIPDRASLEAARAMLELGRATRAGDLVLACITGGSSALLALPAPGVSLEDKQRLTRALLASGADIFEINAVRKHASAVKGGRLALALDPGATLVNLTVSDVIGDALDYVTDPTVPDTSTLADARATLSRYRLWERVPASVRRALESEAGETPKAAELGGRVRHDLLLLPSTAACEAACRAAAARGFTPLPLSTRFAGESRELGRFLAAIAFEVRASGRPLAPPCALVGGGEGVVTLGARNGQGGPNQECALAAARALAGAERVVLAALDTDGSDGPTGCAGALVDGTSFARARALGIDIDAALAGHDVTPALETLGDALVTGATGTNVNDLELVLLGE